ncbi:MBL fold metallo-hydrolase [Candidatus Uhrbacteria bacterium]|nr:MBL fold metallo-hydrolase [Candidatus Uhrbacteria bacterium]
MKLNFYGAVQEVTGSCFLLEVAGKRLLIDCGMFQGARYCDLRNFEPFPFEVASIDAVFITHPHLDHTGRLSKLIRQGYRGPIYLTEPARALLKLILDDAEGIMEENSRRCHEEILFGKEEIDQVMSQSLATNYHREITLAPDLTVMFHDAGHILGSAYIKLKAEGKTVVFSGDIGNDAVPILPPTEPLSSGEVVVCESTYGHRRHEPQETRERKLREIMAETIQQEGVLMIPAFSLERTQEVLYAMNNILTHELKTTIPIFLDSPLAIRATQVYRHYQSYLQFDRSILTEPDRDFFAFPNLRETLTVAESKLINDVPAPKIIIAGSGMMTGGRIMHHLGRYLSDPRAAVLIIGYQAKGTLGRQLYEGAKRVTIFQEPVAVRAQVKAIGSFSAHGDMDKLTRWLRPTDGRLPEKIFLTHGDPEAKELFAVHLRHELRATVEIPQFGKAYLI